MPQRPSRRRSSGEAELLPRLTRYLDYFQALAEVGKSLTKNLVLDDVIATVGRSVTQLLKPRNWSLLRVDEARQDLYFKVAVGDAAPALEKLRLGMGEGIAGWVVQNREAVVVPRVADDPRFSSRADRASRFQTSSVVCVPLVCRDRVLGVIELVKDASDPEPYGAEHLEILAPLADYAAIAIDNARTFARVQELTVVDEWTGLANARFLTRFLEDETRRARRYHHELSVVFLDLDEFKRVNDTHGHGAGSAVLKHVGDVLRGCVRDTDRAARYGGDEFVVVMPETPKAGALAMAERLRVAIAGAPYAHGSATVSVTASLGIATFPGDGADGAAVLAAADHAMYAAKAAGKNTLVDAATRR